MESGAHWNVNDKGATDRHRCRYHCSHRGVYLLFSVAFATPEEPDSDVSQVMYSIGIDTNKIDRSFPIDEMPIDEESCFVFSYGGPARKRYAQYFLSILYTPNPPPSQNTPLAVDHVIITGLDEIKT